MIDNTDNPAPLSDQELDKLLANLSDSLDIPQLADSSALARRRVEARVVSRSPQPRAASIFSAHASQSDDRPRISEPKEILGLPLDEQRSRIREIALLAAGLAAALILTVGLAFVFRGFGAGENELPPAPVIADHPLAQAPFDLPGYRHVGTIGRPQTPNAPIDLVARLGGGYLVADGGLDRVIALTADGDLDESWGDRGVSVQLESVIGVAVGPNGNTYVLGRQVYELNDDGGIVSTTDLPSTDGHPGAPFPSSFVGPAVDRNDTVYLGHRAIDTIWGLDPGGTFRIVVEHDESGTVALDSDESGNIFALTADGLIVRIDSDGTAENQSRLANNGEMVDLDVTSRHITVLTRRPELPDESTVIQINRQNDNIALWNANVRAGSPGSGARAAIEVDVTSEIAITDPSEGAIHRFGVNGEHLATLRDNSPDAFSRLWRIALGPNGEIVAYDPTPTPRITVFNDDGRVNHQFDVVRDGVSPSDSGLLFDNPLLDAPGLAVSADGEIILGDAPGSTIQIYASDGGLLSSWGELGFDGSGLFAPTAIFAVGDNALYVADDTGLIREFTSDGDFVRVLGDLVTDRRDLWYHDEAVWAVDGSQILRFPLADEDPEVIARSIFADAEQGDIPGQLLSLALTPDGNLIVFSVDIIPTGDASSGATQFVPTVSMIAPSGELIWSRSLDPSRNQYLDLAIHTDGTLYIADSLTRQIFVFEPSGEASLETPTPVETSALEPLFLQRISTQNAANESAVYDPRSRQQLTLPTGQVVGISPDRTLLFLLDRARESDRLRVDLIAVSTSTFAEVWRTDIAARSSSGPNTRYFDTLVTEESVFVAIHDPDFRGQMLEIVEISLENGALS